MVNMRLLEGSLSFCVDIIQTRSFRFDFSGLNGYRWIVGGNEDRTGDRKGITAEVKRSIRSALVSMAILA